MGTDDIGAATKALAEAVTALSKSMGRNFAELGHDVNSQVAGSLRAASQELSEVSVRIGRDSAATSTKRSQQTRARLIEAARRLFAEQGYEAASLGDVATEAGFTKGAVYANFASKEDLLLEVAKNLAEENERLLNAAEQPAAEALAQYLGAPGQNQNQILTTEIALYAARHPEVREQLTDLFDQSVTRVARLIATGNGGSPDNPTRHDRDTAIGMLAIGANVQLLGPSTDGDTAEAVAGRLINRLLQNP